MSDPDKPERCLLVDAQPVGSVSADHVARAIRTMRSTPPVTHLAVGAVQMAQMIAALDEPNEAVLAGRRPGKTRSNHDALYQPPWVEVPPPTVRSAEALAKVRAFKQARRAARRRLGKSKDRAGRPL